MAATLGPKRQAQRLAKTLEIVAAFPEAEVKASGRSGEHRTMTIRKKTFAYYLYDHHGDGIVSIAAKAAAGAQAELIHEDPDNYYRPDYLGPKGWVALRLDRARLDWGDVAELLVNAYCLQAPKKLAARVE